MSLHGNASVQAIFHNEGLKLITNVDLLRMPLSFVKKRLLAKGVNLGCGLDCEKCAAQPEGCVDLRNSI